MNILFESKYERTNQFYREVYFYNYFKRPFNMFLMLFMAVLLALNLFFVIRDSWSDFISDVSVGIGILFFVLYFASYPVMVNLAKKRDAEVNSKADSNIYALSVTEDKIIHHAPSGIEIEVRYAKISKIYQSKNYIMFVSDSNLLYAMQKDKFTVGDYSALLEFLRSKGYKI